MDKHKIISDMCMTMDHRYFASPEMFKNDSFNQDFTQEYKDGLYRQMKQVFENNIEPILKNICTTTQRAFLDEIQEKGRWSESNDEYTGIAIGDYTFINQSDFTTALKELVNDPETEID